MVALAKQAWTAEEYLAFERASAEKHEYLAGEITLMTGASRRHNLIVFNIAVALGSQLRNRPCEAYLNDMRVRVGERDYVYPDVVVACEEPLLEDDQLDTLLNPTVILEVLSPSTEPVDRGRKFERYRALPSLREYLLVAQDAAHIERYARHAEGWILSEAKGLDASIGLEAIGCALALADVYAKVAFDVSDEGGHAG